MARKKLTHDEYLASDLWKCAMAPINTDIPIQVQEQCGAHHWVEIQPNPDGTAHTGIFCCKYCGDCRRYPVYWSQVNP